MTFSPPLATAFLSAVRVDGGMTENNWLMQFLADILDMPIDRPLVRETTALGAAMLALMQVTHRSRWTKLPAAGGDASFAPQMDSDTARSGGGMEFAVQRTLTDVTALFGRVETWHSSRFVRLAFWPLMTRADSGSFGAGACCRLCECKGAL